MIEVSGVTHAYGVGAARREVLREVSVSLAEPRIGVVGANGSGKSTFARLLNGLVVPSHGTVTVDGMDTRTRAKDVRRRVGFCFTDPDAQIVMPTVQEDVAFGLRKRLPKDEVTARVARVLTDYGLAGHADHPTHLLSGGQKQLLALVSVLVTEPSILVLDEPTTLLDLRNTRQVARTVAGLEQQVVLVTHDLELVEDFDRVLVFDDARLVVDAAPAEALAHYRASMGG